ncbi:MAG TPA: ArsB/NhaD family transporter [Polyangiaceae bacterium]
MDEAFAYSTLALTMALAVSRPRVGLRGLRFTPGTAALLGVALLVALGLVGADDFVSSARIQWRPLVALASIMVMTGVVQEVGAFDRLALRLEAYARRAPATRVFAIVFAASVVTPSLLNNDSAILLLTPLVVAFTRRVYAGRPALLQAFAFAIFLAPGVAPFVVSNPMNMIVAEFAGIGFQAYAAVMAPIAVAGALLTFVILRLHFRRALAVTPAASSGPVVVPPARPGERAAVALLLAVFLAYPLAAALDAPVWVVSAGGALAALGVARARRIAPARAVLGHVSVDILVFLWGVFIVVVGLRHVGVVDRLHALFAAALPGSARQIGTVGAVAALGSAVVDNHPMSILDMMALGGTAGHAPLLAALVGGDIGPRLLPVGSLAGLLWMDLLRRAGVEISIGKFVRLGTLVLLPTLALSLALLWLLTRAV